MSVLIGFPAQFGGVAMAAGLLWLYVLYHRGGHLTEVLPGEFNKPVAAAVVLAVRIVMLMAPRGMTARIWFQVKQMRAEGPR